MDRESAHKEYSNGEVVVVWQPARCQHSGICVMNLPEVFKPREKPWIQTEGGSTEEIINTVRKCPSGALSYRMVEQKEQ